MSEHDKAARTATDELQRQRLRNLISLAATVRVEQMHSRWVAAVPFGAGQFQNGDDDLGIFLAIAEGTLLATSVVAYAIHESLRGQMPTLADRGAARSAEAASRYTNQLSLVGLGVLAVSGIVDAQVRFKPSRSFDRPRALPPDLPDLGVSAGPGGLMLFGRF